MKLYEWDPNLIGLMTLEEEKLRQRDRDREKDLPLSPCIGTREKSCKHTAKGNHLQYRRRALIRTEPHWHLDLKLPAQTMRK